MAHGYQLAARNHAGLMSRTRTSCTRCCAPLLPPHVHAGPPASLPPYCLPQQLCLVEPVPLLLSPHLRRLVGLEVQNCCTCVLGARFRSSLLGIWFAGVCSGASLQQWSRSGSPLLRLQCGEGASFFHKG